MLENAFPLCTRYCDFFVKSRNIFRDKRHIFRFSYPKRVRYMNSCTITSLGTIIANFNIAPRISYQCLISRYLARVMSSRRNLLLYNILYSLISLLSADSRSVYTYFVEIVASSHFLRSFPNHVLFVFLEFFLRKYALSISIIA